MRTFTGAMQTCRVQGAWPLVDNRYLAVQVTNEPVLEDSNATATTKVRGEEAGRGVARAVRNGRVPARRARPAGPAATQLNLSSERCAVRVQWNAGVGGGGGRRDS